MKETKIWTDKIVDFLKTIVIAILVCGVIFFAYYCLTAKKQEMIPKSVIYINDWEYSLDGDNWEKVEFPCKLSVDNSVTVYYRAKMPNEVKDGMWMSMLNSKDMVIYIDGAERFTWSRNDAYIPGGPSKSVFMFVPLFKSDTCKEILVVKSGRYFNGGMEKVLIGDSLSVYEELKNTSGSLQMFAAIFVLMMSVIVVIIGFCIKYFYGKNITLIPLGVGVMITSLWLILDTNAFQLVFGVRYVDGFLSYVLTLIMVFPYILYIDSLQKQRYRKLYLPLALLQLISLVVCTTLHLTGISNYANMMIILDLIIAAITFVILCCTILDLLKGDSSDYHIVAVGFVIFAFFSIVEIVILNKEDFVRIDGTFIILGLFIFMISAVTQQIEDIKKFQKIKNEEDEANKAKTEFLTNMSHEIRTPINTILGMNDMILEENNSETIKAYAERIRHSGRNLLDIVDDILDFARSQTRQIDITNSDYKVKDVVDDMAAILKLSAQEKGLAVNIGFTSDMPEYLNGDSRHIERVLSNIISNAVKYTEKGAVSFDVDCKELENDEYMLEFSIEDTGKGIKEADIPKLFTPFFRSDINKNRSLEGTGLGLAITKELVDKMGGTIEVDSIYGRGSTFTVKIPQHKALDINEVSEEKIISQIQEETHIKNSAEIEEISKLSAKFTAPNARILAVDDNSSNLVVIREFIRSIEAQIDLVPGGKEAIEICEVNKYDIILMDHMMPQPDGIEAMHHIKSDENSINQDTPIVVLTANAVGDCRSMYIKEGFDNYLSKPVSRDVLLKVIRYYIAPDLVNEKVQEDNRVENSSSNSSDKISDNSQSESDSIIDFEGLSKRFEGQSAVVNMVLAECVKEGEKKIALLKDVYEKGDIARYAVEAHGVKGVMASICANKISERAKKHEFAGKEKRSEFIGEDIDGFLAEYRSVLDYIEDYLAKKGIEIKKPVVIEKNEDGSQSIESIINEIDEALDEFDVDKALKLIDKLEAVAGDDEKELVDQVRQYADDFQYDLAKDSLKKLHK